MGGESEVSIFDSNVFLAVSHCAVIKSNHSGGDAEEACGVSFVFLLLHIYIEGEFIFIWNFKTIFEVFGCNSFSDRESIELNLIHYLFYPTLHELKRRRF